MAFVFFVAGCTKPEEKLWTWNYQDSVDIQSRIDAERNFLSSRMHLDGTDIKISLPDDIIQKIRNDTASGRVRYMVSKLSFIVADSVLSDSFTIDQLDTTVTAGIVDTLKGKAVLFVDSLFKADSVSAVAPAANEAKLEKFYHYSSYMGVFCDSVGGKWRIAKYSGGVNGWSPDLANAPELLSVTLGVNSGKRVVELEPNGKNYSIRGLLKESDILTVSPKQKISVENIAVKGQDTLLLFVKTAEGWLPFDASSPVSVSFSSAGKHRIYLMGIDLSSLIYKSDEYKSVVWGINVIVK